MTDPVYIPLRLHTEFSITDGTVRIEQAVKQAAAYGLPALGVQRFDEHFRLGGNSTKPAAAPASSRLPRPMCGLKTRKRPKSLFARC